MNALLDVRRELTELASFYGADLPDGGAALHPWLANYAEFVLGERHFEVIGGGVGDRAARELARLARSYGAHASAADWFLRAAKAFPERMLGLKVAAPAGVGSPSLYIRTLTPCEQGLGFLRDLGLPESSVADLRERLGGTKTLYGLGFLGSDEPTVKTYTIGDLDLAGVDWPQWLAAQRPRLPRVGFLSHRLTAEGIRPGLKLYWPDVGWDGVPLDSRWRRVWEKGRELDYRTAGHLGIHLAPAEPPILKLYVERRGAIPTDFTAR